MCATGRIVQGEGATGVTVFEWEWLIGGERDAPMESSVLTVGNGVFVLLGAGGVAQLPEGAARVGRAGATAMPARVEAGSRGPAESPFLSPIGGNKLRESHPANPLTLMEPTGFEPVTSCLQIAFKRM